VNLLNQASASPKDVFKITLNQKELAERLGKSEGWISRFMNDPTNFSVKKLVEISLALGMKLDIRFKEEAEENSGYTSDNQEDREIQSSY
jgi:transcriptional regulator with XRE-family HTH domain